MFVEIWPVHDFTTRNEHHSYATDIVIMRKEYYSDDRAFYSYARSVVAHARLITYHSK